MWIQSHRRNCSWLLHTGRRSTTNTSNTESAFPGSISMTSTRTPRTVEDIVGELSDVVDEGESLIQEEPTPQMTLSLVKLAARAMGGGASVLHENKFIQSWPVSASQSLVASANSLDDWNAIAAVSRVEVLSQQRQFPFIFPSTEVGESRAFKRPRAITIFVTFVFGIVAGVAFAAWLLELQTQRQSDARLQNGPHYSTDSLPSHRSLWPRHIQWKYA